MRAGERPNGVQLTPSADHERRAANEPVADELEPDAGLVDARRQRAGAVQRLVEDRLAADGSGRTRRASRGRDVHQDELDEVLVAVVRDQPGLLVLLALRELDLGDRLPAAASARPAGSRCARRCRRRTCRPVRRRSPARPRARGSPTGSRAGSSSSGSSSAQLPSNSSLGAVVPEQSADGLDAEAAHRLAAVGVGHGQRRGVDAALPCTCRTRSAWSAWARRRRRSPRRR